MFGHTNFLFACHHMSQRNFSRQYSDIDNSEKPQILCRLHCNFLLNFSSINKKYPGASLNFRGYFVKLSSVCYIYQLLTLYQYLRLTEVSLSEMKMLKPLLSFLYLFCFTYAILDDSRYIYKEGLYCKHVAQTLKESWCKFNVLMFVERVNLALLWQLSNLIMFYLFIKL